MRLPAVANAGNCIVTKSFYEFVGSVVGGSIVSKYYLGIRQRRWCVCRQHFFHVSAYISHGYTSPPAAGTINH